MAPVKNNNYNEAKIGKRYCGVQGLKFKTGTAQFIRICRSQVMKKLCLGPGCGSYYGKKIPKSLLEG